MTYKVTFDTRHLGKRWGAVIEMTPEQRDSVLDFLDGMHRNDRLFQYDVQAVQEAATLAIGDFVKTVEPYFPIGQPYQDQRVLRRRNQRG